MKLINDFLEKYDYDVRKSNYYEFMNQKTIPDVLCVVAECVLEYIKTNQNTSFTKSDIWHSDFANEIITTSFNKPNLKNADKEYDKFFSQPLKLLAYARVLKLDKKGNTNYYTVNENSILEYISLRERNALNFLELYLTKVLTDSDIYSYFDLFFKKQDKNSLHNLRETLFTFYKKHTNIQGDKELPRIFNKIINILAFKKKLKGTVRGHLSKTTLLIESIRYNSVNWRDIEKDKQLTRQEYKEIFANENPHINFYKYSVQKAKQFVKKIHKTSEIHRFENYIGSQAHHIFIASEYPDIADFPENIICITPNQHFLRALPNNKTSVVDNSYQLICLISKLDSIEISYHNEDDNYSLDDFLIVLNKGFNTDCFKPKMEFEEIKHQIITLNHKYLYE